MDNKLPKKNLMSFQLDISKLQPATEEEKAQQIRMSPSSSFWKDALKRLRKNKLSMTCFWIIVVIALMVIFIPMLWPYSYEQQLGITAGQPVDGSYANLRPFKYGKTELARMEAGEKIFPHIFGTDDMGRDYFIRVIYGARVSLFVGVFASVLVLIIGILYGSISGYVGGKTDLIMMRVVDIIYSLPDMLIIILLSVVFNKTLAPILEGTVLEKLGANMISIFIVFGLLYWVGMARLVRGQILSLKEQEFVLASKSTGAGSGWIIRKHLIPNSMSVIIISAALQIPNAIFTESFLSFLGLGVSAPMPSLGSLASNALSGIYSYSYRLLLPALFIFLIVLSFNIFGSGLRDAFDPKLKN